MNVLTPSRFLYPTECDVRSLLRRIRGAKVGVASHEERRFGLNETKRRRLVRDGAHTVVPDFSQWKRLVEWLG